MNLHLRIVSSKLVIFSSALMFSASVFSQETAKPKDIKSLSWGPDGTFTVSGEGGEEPPSEHGKHVQEIIKIMQKQYAFIPQFPVDFKDVKTVETIDSPQGKIYLFSGPNSINYFTVQADPETHRLKKLGVRVGSHSDDFWYDTYELDHVREDVDVFRPKDKNINGENFFGVKLRQKWQNHETKEVPLTDALTEVVQQNKDNGQILINSGVISAPLLIVSTSSVSGLRLRFDDDQAEVHGLILKFAADPLAEGKAMIARRPESNILSEAAYLGLSREDTAALLDARLEVIKAGQASDMRSLDEPVLNEMFRKSGGNPFGHDPVFDFFRPNADKDADLTYRLYVGMGGQSAKADFESNPTKSWGRIGYESTAELYKDGAKPEPTDVLKSVLRQNKAYYKLIIDSKSPETKKAEAMAKDIIASVATLTNPSQVTVTYTLGDGSTKSVKYDLKTGQKTDDKGETLNFFEEVRK